MARNNVYVEKLQGGLGRRALNTDGVCALITNGVAVVGGLQLGTVYELRSINDLIALKVDAAYDTANKVLVYERVKRFFILNPVAELHLMVLAQSVTMAQMADKANALYAKKLLKDLKGRVKLLAICRNPATGYTPTIEDGLDADVLATIPKAQALLDEEFAQFRFAQIFVEGRSFSGNASSAADLRSLENVEAPNVSVVIHQDFDVANRDALYSGHANVEDFLAVNSVAAVSQNPGERTDRFNLTRVAEGLNVKTGLSSKQLINTFDEQALDALHDKGYLFAEPVSGLDGLYFNDSHTCIGLDSDYAYVENNRTINKALFLARTAILPNVNSRLIIDETTGRLIDIERSRLEDAAVGAVETMQRDGDISGGVVAYIDPSQNLLAGDDIILQLTFVPVSIGRKFRLKIGFSNPFNSN